MLADFISFQIDYKNTMILRRVTTIVNITLRDRVYHEDVGFGMQGMALDKVTRSSPIIPWYDHQLVRLTARCSIQCKRETVTHALKRTLRSFGNLLGNRPYDKEYTKVCLRPSNTTWCPYPTNWSRKWSKFKSRHQNSIGRPEYAGTPSGNTFATGSPNARPSNMGPPPVVPAWTTPTQSGPKTQLHHQTQ
jgi:hypothetical protein